MHLSFYVLRACFYEVYVTTAVVTLAATLLRYSFMHVAYLQQHFMSL